MGRTERLLLFGALLTMLMLVGGCVFIDARFTLQPDGTKLAQLETGVLRTMVEQGEGDFSSNVSEGLNMELWQEGEEFDRDQWHVWTLTGRAAPGQELFAEDAQVAPEFTIVRRLLTTDYEFEMRFPEGSMQMEKSPAQMPPQEGDAEVEVEGMEQMGAAMAQMMAMMMQSGEAGVRFSVTLPGEIIDANGQRIGPGTVGWAIDPTGAEPPEALSARSRLINWPNLGRLAGEIVEMGRWDVVPALIAATRRGLVPDPVSDAPMEAELDAELYAQIAEIVGRLDGAVGEAITGDVVTQLGLNDADVDPSFVANVLERVRQDDFASEIDESVTEDVLERLGGE